MGTEGGAGKGELLLGFLQTVSIFSKTRSNATHFSRSRL